MIGNNRSSAANEEAAAMSIVIKNGTVVTADMTYKADVRLQGSKIESVGPNLSGDQELGALLSSDCSRSSSPPDALAGFW